MNWIWLVLFLATAGVGYFFWKKPPESPLDIKSPIVAPADEGFRSDEDTSRQGGSLPRTSGPLGDSAVPKMDPPPTYQNPGAQTSPATRPSYPQNSGGQPPPPAEMFDGGDPQLPVQPGGNPGAPIAPDDPMYEPMPNNPNIPPVDPGTNFEGQEMAPPPPVYEPPASDDYVVPDTGDGDF